MEQKTLNYNGRIIYCYSDGSIEFVSSSRRFGGSKNIPKLIRTFGRVKSPKEKYRLVELDNKSIRVHRLIAMAFHPNTDNLPEVDHINRDRGDNRPENLRWADHLTNAKNRVGAGRPKKKFTRVSTDS